MNCPPFLDGYPRLLYYLDVIRFQDLECISEIDIETALQRNDPAELPLVPVTVALVFPECAVAQAVCTKLSVHPDNRIRGNAVMSLGYLARRFRMLDRQSVQPVIESALQDRDEYVRANAKSAADEIHQFLHWEIAGHVYG